MACQIKAARGRRQRCLQDLDQLLDGVAGTLLDCAVEYECLASRRSVKCIDCFASNDIGRYVHGAWYADKIVLCANNWNDLPSEKRKDFLLEEVYHALTICTEGTRSNALNVWEHMVDQQLATNPGGVTTKRCAMCMGKETFAQGCVRKMNGLGGGLGGTLAGAQTSCQEECDQNAFIFSDPLFHALEAWLSSTALPACDTINQNCGL